MTVTDIDISTEIMSLIGELAAYRKAHGITQYQVADIMHTRQGAISAFERGLFDPRLSRIFEYCRAVGIKLIITVDDE